MSNPDEKKGTGVIERNRRDRARALAFRATLPRGTSQRPFYHCMESLVAGRTVLSKMRAGSIRVVLPSRPLQPLPIDAGTGHAIGRQRKQAQMWRYQRIINQTEVGVDAGPVVLPRPLGHRGSHRVELDVAVDRYQVPVAVDKAGLEAAPPWWSATTMPPMECLHVALTELAHGARQRIAFGRCQHACGCP